MIYGECSTLTLRATLASVRLAMAAYGPLERLVCIERAVVAALRERGMA